MPPAASAGRAVVTVVAEKVATTRAATTSRVVANLCFTTPAFLQCAGTLDGHGPNPLGLKTSTLVPGPLRSGSRVTGFKGPPASPSSRCQKQAATTRSR